MVHGGSKLLKLQVGCLAPTESAVPTYIKPKATHVPRSIPQSLLHFSKVSERWIGFGYPEFVTNDVTIV